MNPPSPLTLDDYESIEQAVMETERGRWFLAEFARRNRAADTGEILEALGRLEGRIAETRVLPAPPPPEPEPQIERIAPTLAKLADAASRLRSALDAPAEAEERVELAVSRIATLERAIAAVRNVAAGVAQPPEAEPASTPEASALAAPEVVPEPARLPPPQLTFARAPKAVDEPKPEPASAPEPVRTPPADDAAATREAKREARIRAAQARMQARAQRAAPQLPPRAPQPAIPPAWSRAAEERMTPPRPLAPGPLSRALLESLSDVEKALLFA
ncbi:hypothetical protein [Methylopila sp. 73B]|uniref:hypothetical protein n=1 Tax=Methylopila sp. 73B TaxID=1120792 RepID=UPI00037658AA|nr:hypothetical protein [Methylopila sp. 73B]